MQLVRNNAGTIGDAPCYLQKRVLANLLKRREGYFEAPAEKTAATRQLWIRVLGGDATLPPPFRPWHARTSRRGLRGCTRALASR